MATAAMKKILPTDRFTKETKDQAFKMVKMYLQEPDKDK